MAHLHSLLIVYTTLKAPQLGELCALLETQKHEGPKKLDIGRR